MWFGFASGPPDVCGPYTRPFFRREVQRDLGRELGRDLGQRRVRPFAIVHRPPHAGHSLGQNSGPSSGQANASKKFGFSSLGYSANYIDLEGSMQNNAPEVSWQPKPRTRVFDFDSSQCVRLPRILDFLMLHSMIPT